MARLRSAPAPDGESTSTTPDISDEEEDHDVLQNLVSDLPDPPSQQLSSGDRSDTSEDAAASQLRRENMGSALSKEDPNDHVLAAAKEFFSPSSIKPNKFVEVEAPRPLHGFLQHLLAPGGPKPAGQLRSLAKSPSSLDEPALPVISPAKNSSRIISRVKRSTRQSHWDVPESPIKEDASAPAQVSATASPKPRELRSEKPVSSQLSDYEQQEAQDHVQIAQKTKTGRKTRSKATIVSPKRPINEPQQDKAASPSPLKKRKVTQDVQEETATQRRSARDTSNQQPEARDPEAIISAVKSPQSKNQRTRGRPAKPVTGPAPSERNPPEQSKGAKSVPKKAAGRLRKARHPQEPSVAEAAPEDDEPQAPVQLSEGDHHASSPSQRKYSPPVSTVSRRTSRESPLVVVDKNVEPDPEVPDERVIREALTKLTPEQREELAVSLNEVKKKPARQKTDKKQRIQKAVADRTRVPSQVIPEVVEETTAQNGPHNAPVFSHDDGGREISVDDSGLEVEPAEVDSHLLELLEDGMVNDLLLGEAADLIRVVLAVNKIGLRRVDGGEMTSELEVCTPSGEAARKACEAVIAIYRNLLGEGEGKLEPPQDELDDKLWNLKNIIDALDPQKEQFATQLAQDVYGTVIPGLVSVLKTVILYHAVPATARVAASNEGQLSLSAITVIGGIVRLILELYERSRSWKFPTGLGIIKPVQSMRAPLERFFKTLNAERLRRKQDDQTKEAATKRRQRKEAERQQRVKEGEDRQKFLEEKRRRDDLYLARRDVEIYLSNDRAQHLAQPDDWPINMRGVVEIDADGLPYTREDIFGCRKDFSKQYWAHAFTQVEDKPWADEQEDALIEALERFPGPNAYRKIFKHYCGFNPHTRGYGPLRELNVRQILQKAAWIKKCLLEREELDAKKDLAGDEERFVAPDYVRSIEVLDY